MPTSSKIFKRLKVLYEVIVRTQSLASIIFSYMVGPNVQINFLTWYHQKLQEYKFEFEFFKKIAQINGYYFFFRKMGRFRSMTTVFFYIYFCFVNYWDTANNPYLIRTRRKTLELLKILWQKYFWDLNELEYITEKIN